MMIKVPLIEWKQEKRFETNISVKKIFLCETNKKILTLIHPHSISHPSPSETLPIHLSFPFPPSFHFRPPPTPIPNAQPQSQFQQYYPIIPTMRATTTKQLMDQSKLFRFLFWGSITAICLGTIFMIVFPFTECNYRSCSWWYYNSYECYSGSRAYCCYSGATYCGNWNYCWYKPMQPCIGWMIAGSTLLGSGFLLAIFVFVMFCNFRSKIRNGTGYLNVPGNQVFNAYQPPVVIYSNPNQQPQYQQYVPPQQQVPQQQPINFSEAS